MHVSTLQPHEQAKQVLSRSIIQHSSHAPLVLALNVVSSPPNCLDACHCKHSPAEILLLQIDDHKYTWQHHLMLCEHTLWPPVSRSNIQLDFASQHSTGRQRENALDW